MDTKKTSSISENVQSALIVISLIAGVVSAGYGLMQWIDNRYINTERYIAMSAVTVVAIYEQRLVDLNNRLEFILEFQPADKTQVIHIREEINQIKKNRKYFLETGHFPIGDEMIVNQRMIIRKFNKE